MVKDTRKRKANPSGRFPTLHSPLACSLLFPNPLSTHKPELNGLLRYSFVSYEKKKKKERECQILNHRKKREKKSAFSFLHFTHFLFSLSPRYSFALLLLPLFLLSFFLPLHFLTLSIQDNARNKLSGETKRTPGPSLVDPLSRHVVFSQCGLITYSC